jgi:hypothetical protein
MQIREVAAPAARNQDLFPGSLGAFHHRDALSALARFDRAHQAGRAGAQDHHIKGLLHGRYANAKRAPNPWREVKAPIIYQMPASRPLQALRLSTALTRAAHLWNPHVFLTIS